MYYAEINENGKCFHITQDKLPNSENVLVTDENVLGKIWNGTDWEKEHVVDSSEQIGQGEPVEDVPTQLDRIEEKLNILTADSVTMESIETAIAEGVNEA